MIMEVVLRDVSDRIGAQIASAEKEENRTTPRANRVELALSRNLEEVESGEAKEAPGHYQGECRVGESPQENTKHAFQLELDCKTREPQICPHKFLPRPLLDSRRPGGSNPIRETTLGRTVEKPEKTAGRMLISRKKLENVLKKLKNGKGSPDQITADVLKALPPECLEKLARSLSLMCWDVTFPEDWMCSMTVMAPKVVGATVLDQVQANCWTLYNTTSLGLCLAHVTQPPLKYESVQTAVVPKKHADAGLVLLLKAAELSRE